MKAVFEAGEIAPSEPEHDQKKPATAILILAAFFIFAGLSVTLGLHSPSPERCVAIFQNIATLFFLLCIFQLGRAATQLPSANPWASIRALILPLALGALVWAGSISTYFISDDFEHLRAMASPLKKIA